jgi:hypothetical protein
MQLTKEQIDMVLSIVKDTTGNINVSIVVFMGKIITMDDNTLLYAIDISDKLDINCQLAVQGGLVYIEDKTNKSGKKAILGIINILPKEKIDFILNKYNELIYNTTIYPKIYEQIDIQEDPDIQSKLLIKTSEGSTNIFFNANNCKPFVPVFNGLINYKNKDKINIAMYDLGNHIIQVVHSGYKAKIKTNYQSFYKILDVNRPIRTI